MLRSIPSGSQYQMFMDTLEWIGRLFTTIFNLPLPWLNLTFGEVLIGPAFICLLIGVFKMIFASVGSSARGGGSDD